MDIPAVKNWWEAPLETDFTKQAPEVEATIYDQPGKQRIYGSPVYDRDGNLRCRCCGATMSRSVSRNGYGLAACTDTGCEATGFEFAEGSYFSDPGRRR
ncbi:MAG: hypothetical protein PVS2B2_26050 [Candidatus Acidiferrum sp.]